MSGSEHGAAARPPLPLLVGVAQPWPGPPRELLFELLASLDAMGHRADVVFLRDGSERARFQNAARVRLMRDLSGHTPSGLVERTAGALREGSAEQVRELRLRRRHALLAGRRTVHLNGPQAVMLLRYLPSPPATVTTYVHPADLAVDELDPSDRSVLVERTDRFLAADEATAERLVGSGGAPQGKVTVWDRPALVPTRTAPSSAVRAARDRLGIPMGAAVVAVPAVPAWVDSPDLTLALAWELQRRRLRPPVHVYWYGGPYDRRRRWPIEHDLATAAIANLHLDTGEVRGSFPALPEADLVVLPTRDAGRPGTIEHAARWNAPVLCWSNHADASRMPAWGGIVVPFPDVAAMADRVLELLADPGERRRVAATVRSRAAEESARTFRLLGLSDVGLGAAVPARGVVPEAAPVGRGAQP